MLADTAARTFVLIPGAGGAATWYWQLILPLLRQAGQEAIAVDLPSADPAAGLHEYARLVTDAIGSRNKVVLVAQSLGGFTAPLVAASTALTRLVFVNAMIPRPGETPGAWWDNTGQDQARRASAEQKGYPVEFDLETYFLHDVSADLLATGQNASESESVFESTCDFDEWPAIPTQVVAGADDRFFPPEFQQRIASERLGVQADLLPGGHLIALAQPEPLAHYLLES